MTTVLTYLILAYAQAYGVDPTLALSVATVESRLNPQAVGPVGEIGIFQVRPEYSKYSRNDLFHPIINITEGLRILSEAKKSCKYKKDKTFLVCYNAGVVGGNKINHPKQFPYYKKVMVTYNEYKKQ